MKSVIRRIVRLEDRFAPHQEKKPFLMVYTRSDCKLAMDNDTCVQILWECGFLRGRAYGCCDAHRYSGRSERDGAEEISLRTRAHVRNSFRANPPESSRRGDTICQRWATIRELGLSRLLGPGPRVPSGPNF